MIKNLFIGAWVDVDMSDHFFYVTPDTIKEDDHVWCTHYKIVTQSPCNTKDKGYWFGFSYNKYELFGDISITNDTLKFHEPLANECGITVQYKRKR